jgi:1-acyl-sn-glycerol-3-phosphate acyltransferase
MTAPALPVAVAERPVKLRGSRVARALLRGAGWKLEFDGLPARQGVIVVYPHTSNWDFVVGMLAKWAIGLQVAFWAKASLFRLPLMGAWMRGLGGVPVDRSAPADIVADMVARMKAARDGDRFLWLALAPDGTRARARAWRSGFYRIALQAGVPLGLAHLDFAGRRVGIRTFLRLCGRPDADMRAVADALGWARGHHPQLATPIDLP